MIKYSPLKSTEITLRAVEPDDAEFLWNVECDSEHWVLNGMMAPVSREMMTIYAATYDANPQRDGQIRFIIHISGSSERIGIVDLYDLSFIHKRGYVGIYIIPEFRNSHYAGKSISIIEDYAESVLNIKRLAAKIALNNLPCLRMFRRIGYEHSGTLPGWIQSGSDEIDVAIYVKDLSQK